MPFLDVERLKKMKGERQKVSFAGDLPPVNVDGNQVEFAGPAQFDLVLTNVGNAIDVDGNIKVDIKVQCSRCLEDFTLSMDAAFHETYYDKAFQARGDNGEEWIPYTGDTIDITPEAQGTVLINLPLRFVCREECRGLCPVCGVNRNLQNCDCARDDTDPRLAKLKDLFK